tara:strand:+ start:20 stop:469 length:450 start_codon:yes stop_codon:yes gene_type:complete
MQDEINWSNCKNISFLYANSILLGLKTIVFLTSSSYDTIAGNEKFIDYEKLNNSNFFIYPTILSYISEMEFNDREKLRDDNESYMPYSFRDFRRNHFSEENHEIMCKNIKKIIKNDYELINFARHLNPTNYYGTVSFDESIDDNKFIYD